MILIGVFLGGFSLGVIITTIAVAVIEERV